jgi:arabinan endo-1,5-alpha-L-arabinosidase
MKPSIFSCLFQPTHGLCLAAVLSCICVDAFAQTDDDAAKRRRPMPPQVTTNPNVHDPVLAWEGDTCYLFMTGNGVGSLWSTDMKEWHRGRSVLAEAPEWARTLVPGYRGHTWAPDVQRVGDQWLLYYSCSTFGSNRSAIGLAVNKTLNPNSPDYRWEDRGLVITSEPKKTNWNAIDPNLILDEKGNPWLVWGSFWDGIQMVRLEDDFQYPAGKPKTVARKRGMGQEGQPDQNPGDNAIEAPFIIHHDGYYYLFVSFDYCCKGLQSTYKTAVGRSKNIEGPYVDDQGRKMTQGGGKVLVGETPDYAGVGHTAAYLHDRQWWFVAHGYSKTENGASKLVLRKMNFKNGWPEIEM